MTARNEQEVTLTRSPAYQGVTLWLGDATVVQIDDDMSPGDLRQDVDEPIRRAAFAARLRVIADILDDRPDGRFTAMWTEA